MEEVMKILLLVAGVTMSLAVLAFVSDHVIAPLMTWIDGLSEWE
jgi:hypothetical protein